MNAWHETRDSHALKAGTVEEISIASSGDEFLDILIRHLDDAEGHVEKAVAVARRADDDHARANERLYAIRAAVEAYREASAQRMARKSDADR